MNSRSHLLVMKFGGTSMGSAERIDVAARLTTEQHQHRPVAIVVSAMSKVTDLLLDTLRKAEAGDEVGLDANIQTLTDRHLTCCHELLPEGFQETALAGVKGLIAEFVRIAKGILMLGERPLSSVDRAIAIGERLSALLMAAYLESQGTPAAAVNAAQVIATDVSAAALLVARDNASITPVVDNVRFIQADLSGPITGKFQVIASNLPYIATADLSILDVAHFEPHVALDGGSDGLALIRRLLFQAPSRLATPGLFLIEHGADQGPAALALVKQAFPTDTVALLQDDAGLDRAVRVERR